MMAIPVELYKPLFFSFNFRIISHRNSVGDIVGKMQNSYLTRSSHNSRNEAKIVQTYIVFHNAIRT